jgi:hypothetical protein
MKNNHIHTITCVTGLLFVLTARPVWGQTEDAHYKKLETEINSLRQQMNALQEEHARVLAELRAFLPKQGFSTSNVPQTVASPVAQPVPPEKTPSLYESLKSSAASLVPSQVQAIPGMDMDISAVLDLYFYHDDSKEGVSHLKQELSGFSHHHDEAGGHDHGGSENGFNLRHVELGFSAEVDPYVRAWTTVAVDEDGAELEEAVLQTTSLPYGLTFSGGKLKSGIGRLNRQHSHNWDFLDQPLVYDLFFGAHGLTEKGVQLTWLAPTPFYLLLGTEVFNGDNEQSFAVAEAEGLSSHDAPRLWTGFIKVGPDLGPNHALLAGLSALVGRHQMVHEAAESADGRSMIYGVDFVYKYDAKRTHGLGDFILQGEYFYRDIDLDGKGDWDGSTWSAQQDGYYLQSLYGLLPRWRAGLRWEQVGLLNDLKTPEDGSVSFGETSRLATVLEWKLSEFSLLRAQVGHGWYETHDGMERAWEFGLQWQLSFGKHAAHDF